MPFITELDALEILDSRGRPTLQATCTLEGGVAATAQVPSGASTGRAEARELRDGDPGRHQGLGCRKAVESVRGPLRALLAGRDWENQAALDHAMVECDGTPNKARLGANAILAVSIAFARASAVQRGVPLYRHLARMADAVVRHLPRPTVNLFSGGKHAGCQVAIQDVLILPVRAGSMDDALADVCSVYQAAAQWAARRHGSRALVADEGGLAPPFSGTEEMLEGAVQAIEDAGLTPGQDMALAIDFASSHFHHQDRYHLDGLSLSSAEMIDRIEQWATRFPVVSVEDGLAEDDWAAWPGLCSRLKGKALVLGDDLLCTNPARIDRAIATRAADALLLKVNQIGSLTEALAARDRVLAEGWHVTVSARSGETEDDWLADLAVGWNGAHIKIGSITRSERLAKYNRLLAIAAREGWGLEPVPGRGRPV